MSWFDTAGLANIAKSALKEAQRTIDKALDIKEENSKIACVNETVVDANNEDYFGTWGIGVNNSQVVTEDLLGDIKATQLPSIWGSFAGSFFDTHHKEYNKTISVDSLDDSIDLKSEHFCQSKLVVQHPEDESVNVILDRSEEEEGIILELHKNEGLNTSDSDKSSSDVLTSPDSNETDSSSDSKQLTNISSLPSTKDPSSQSGDVSRDDSELNLMDHGTITEDTLSNTSLSGSTSTTLLDSFSTVVKPQQMLKDTFKSDDTFSVANNAPLTEAITTAPSRNMDLPLRQVNFLEFNNSIQDTNVIDIPPLNESAIKTCDNLLEAEDASKIDTGSNSTYLKNLLADAMTEQIGEKKVDGEKESHFMDLSQSMIDSSQSPEGNLLRNISLTQLDMPPREASPLSSESRSDMVKIGSDHTSGHTSGDDLETTTSSDIEIISSPNGDSSSTQSRQSPAKQTKADKVDALVTTIAKKNAKSHTRELSEASSISDDSHSMELDRLVKRTSEMSDILEYKESKIIDLNRRNAELTELNSDLKYQLDVLVNTQIESHALSQVTDGYTQRMSALEKKFQQVVQEKDAMKKQLNQCEQEASTRLSLGELKLVILEKDDLIGQLRSEGEKLTERQLHHSNIIKKLRIKEKENESSMKHLKDKIEDLTTETERLKRSLGAKEDVERSQIEAVHQLTAKNKKLENELQHAQSQLDDITQKHNTVKKSLDAAKIELTDKTKITSQLTAKEHLLESLENRKKMAESQNEEAVNQLKYLRSKLHEYECEFLEKERNLRNENTELLRRLEGAEARNEELSHSILEVSKPLVRQLESLQAAHQMDVTNYDKAERLSTLKINDLQTKLQASSDTERLGKEERLNLRSKLATLEGQLTVLSHQKEMLELDYNQQKTEKQMREQELQSKMDELTVTLKAKTDNVDELTKEITYMQLAVEKSSLAYHGEQESKHEIIADVDNNASSPTTSRSNSPTISLGKASIAESMGSSVWSQYESFDTGHILRGTNMFEMQMLQTNLQQREGEVQQLQWELNRREQERILLNLEISTLLTRTESLDKRQNEYESFQSRFGELQQQYDTLCQLFGEKVEENEELRLDLIEVKDMYKNQIDELLKRQKEKL